MKSICTAAALALLSAGCASTQGRADALSVPPGAAPAHAYVPAGDRGAQPRLTVGVSDPNTQLILPWFLNDVVDFVNYR